MPSRGQVAGTMAFVSLIIPWDVAFYRFFTEIDWILFGFGLSSNFRFFFFNVTQFELLDKILSPLSFLFIIMGAILLLILTKQPLVGSSLVLVGAVIYLIDVLYYGLAYGFYIIIPIGFLFAFLAAIVGFLAKPIISTSTTASTSLDRLAKLKELLTSGAITKEEFEEQKKKILGE